MTFGLHLADPMAPLPASRRTRPAVPLFCMTVAGMLGACSADPLTELVVVVQSDMTIPDEFDGFRVVVTGHDGDVATDRYFFLGEQPGEVLLPADFGVMPRGGDASRRVTVEVWATDSGADLFSTRAITGFVEGKTLRLDMFLARRCLSEAKECKPNETCRVQGCAPSEIDPAELPEFDPDQPSSKPGGDSWVLPARNVGASWWDAAFDSTGHVYAAGQHVGPIEVNGTSYDATGASSAMLASFDATGKVRWFKSLSSTTGTLAYVWSVATGEEGRACFTGWFDGRMRVETEELDAGSGQDGFVVCYDAVGSLQWVKSFGGSTNVQPKTVAIAPNGDVGVGGVYGDPMNLGGDPLPDARIDDAFLVRFDGSGEHVASLGFGGADVDDTVWDVAFDGESNMVVGGTVSSGTVDFGGEEQTFSGSKNAFVATYDTVGALRWVRSFPTGSGQVLSHVEAAQDGRVLLIGGFDGAVDFGGGALSGSGGLDVGVALLDAQGAHMASRVFGGLGMDRGLGVRFGAGGVLVVGLHTGDMFFDSSSLLSAPDQNGFVVSLSPDLSSVQWAHTLGMTGADIAHSVDASASGAVLVAGEFAETIEFGPLWAAAAPGGRDGFLLHFLP